MATTAVFTEILVIGLQVEAWLLLAIFSIFGTDWVDVGGAGDFAALLTLLVLALAYVLGIIGDRLADTVLDRLEKTKRGEQIKARMSKRKERVKRKVLASKRMAVMDGSEGMSRFLDYQRSRWRVARATVFNVAIAGPLAALFLAVRTNADLFSAFAVLACALALIPIIYFAGVRIQDAWVARLLDAYDVLQAGPRR